MWRIFVFAGITVAVFLLPRVAPHGTSLRIEGDTLRIRMRGFDKAWALRREIEVALANIEWAKPRNEATFPKPTVRTGGTSVPGVVHAGRFRGGGTKQFWNVHKKDRAIVIKLRNERYDYVVIEPSDPAEAEALFRAVRVDPS
jgi:hypothetical protein